mmetsp:Transcript_11352/g.17026  ORF Transcript_11352/g.17026 Transcript_11352/m.17026 type:complete len:381 (+) Transcript_11352:89-1231(+)|eukprot:CAMPEP_0196801118 /NCGR_PEP_ID=MMETSP1362-20130617/773_1 /TAXON_ID=163516 /ORGANISM="Leptocylindrus danicus, Strain CCMP1856" /LENGTH=380 /DNA_ID=CAMNT_0042171861 /DNA_START=79 /DNA_END=1221 /DNA_ORIENTATION=-
MMHASTAATTTTNAQQAQQAHYTTTDAAALMNNMNERAAALTTPRYVSVTTATGLPQLVVSPPAVNVHGIGIGAARRITTGAHTTPNHNHNALLAQFDHHNNVHVGSLSAANIMLAAASASSGHGHHGVPDAASAYHAHATGMLPLNPAHHAAALRTSASLGAAQVRTDGQHPLSGYTTAAHHGWPTTAYEYVNAHAAQQAGVHHAQGLARSVQAAVARAEPASSTGEASMRTLAAAHSHPYVTNHHGASSSSSSAVASSFNGNNSAVGGSNGAYATARTTAISPARKRKRDVRTDNNKKLDLTPVKERKVTGNVSMCCICFDNEVSHVMIPCGHPCICRDCAKVDLRECPVCRSHVIRSIRFYGTLVEEETIQVVNEDD